MAVFSREAMTEVERGVIGAEINPRIWNYPPSFLLLVLPLSLLPYLFSFLSWLAVTGGPLSPCSAASRLPGVLALPHDGFDTRRRGGPRNWLCKQGGRGCKLVDLKGASRLAGMCNRGCA